MNPTNAEHWLNSDTGAGFDAPPAPAPLQQQLLLCAAVLVAAAAYQLGSALLRAALPVQGKDCISKASPTPPAGSFWAWARGVARRLARAARAQQQHLRAAPGTLNFATSGPATWPMAMIRSA